MFIFPPSRKGLHWWFWICCPFGDTERFWPGLSFLFPLFPPPSLSHSPRSWRGACKVSSHTLYYKNNPGFTGIAMGGWHGGEWGLSGYTAQFPSLTRKNCTVIYCTDCPTCTHRETEEVLGLTWVMSYEIEHKGRSVDVYVRFRVHVRRQYVWISVWGY